MKQRTRGVRRDARGEMQDLRFALWLEANHQRAWTQVARRYARSIAPLWSSVQATRLLSERELIAGDVP